MLSRRASNLLIQKTDAAMRRLRMTWFRLLGMQLGSGAHLRRVKVTGNCQDIRIGANTYLDDYLVLQVSGPPNGKIKIEIGANCGFNRFSVIDACEHVVIGDRTRVGPSVFITDHDHGILTAQTTKALLLKGEPTMIGEDVWLGAGVKILKGVTIGDCCIVGAESIVTKDLPPNSIAVGIPAKVIRQRV